MDGNFLGPGDRTGPDSGDGIGEVDSFVGAGVGVDDEIELGNGNGIVGGLKILQRDIRWRWW